MLEADKTEDKKLVPLRRFAQDGQYTPAYLSILVQRKKLKAKKIGRNFFTSKEWFDEYLEKHAREAKRAVNEIESSRSPEEAVKNIFISDEAERPVEIKKAVEKKSADIKKENSQVENIFSFNKDRIDFSKKENNFLKNKIFNYISSVLIVVILFVFFAPGAAASFVGAIDRIMAPIMNYKKIAFLIGSDFYELAVASHRFGKNIILKTDGDFVGNLRKDFITTSGESAGQIKKEIVSTVDDFKKFNSFLSKKINLALGKEKPAGRVAGVKETNNDLQAIGKEKATTGIFDNIKWFLKKLGDKQTELSLFFGEKMDGAIKGMVVSINNEKMMRVGEEIEKTSDGIKEYNKGYLAAESERSPGFLKNIYASVVDFVLPEEIKEKYSPIREIEKIVVEKEFVPHIATGTEYIVEQKEPEINQEEIAKIVNSIVDGKSLSKPETVIEKTIVEKVEYINTTTSPIVVNNYTNNNYYSSGPGESSNNFSVLATNDLTVNNSGEIKGNLKVGGNISANYLNLSNLGVENLISGRGLSAGKYGLSSDGDVRFNGENNYISGILNLSNILNIDYSSALALAVGDGASDTFAINTSQDLVTINGVNNIYANSTSPALTAKQSGAGGIFSLYNGTSEVFTVSNAGWVGIGIASPGGALDVAGSICFNGDCKTSWADAATTAGYWTAATGGIHYSSGNIGIGTTTASFLLTVGATSTEQFLVNSVGVVMGGTWNGNIISSAYLPIDIMYQGNNISLLANNSGYITSSTAETLINKIWNGDAVGVAYGGTGLNSILIDEMIYGSGVGMYATTTITSIGRALLDDIDVIAQRTTLGLGSMSLEGNTGSTTINTLGTITTGVWNGSPIDMVYTNLATSTGISLAGSALGLTLGEIDHNSLNNLLTGDAHTQYVLLGGRAGGQTLVGGAVGGDNLVLNSNLSDNGYIIMNANGGNVGIGTTTPSAALTVGATAGNQFLVNSSGVITDGTWQGDVVGLGYGGTGTSTAFSSGSIIFSNGSSLAQDNSKLYWDDTNNRLSIGATTSSATLHIKQGAQSAANGLWFEKSIDGINYQLWMDASNKFNIGYYTGSIFKFTNTGGVEGGTLSDMLLYPDITDVANATAYTFDTKNTLATSTAVHTKWLNNTTELMRLDKSGYLGIGTSSPATPLQVVGNASANAVLIDNGTYYAVKRSDGVTPYSVLGMSSGNTTHLNGPINVIITHNAGSGYSTTVRNSSAAGDTAFKILNYGAAGTSNTASTYFQAYRTGNTATDVARIAGSLSDIDTTNYKGQLDFYTNNAGSLTSKMTINYSGNVGIGTTTPAQGLHIGSVASGKNVMIAKGGLCVDDDDNCATAFADGHIVAKSSNLSGADYAEYFYTVDTDLEPGEIVCVDVANDNAIKRCDRGADDNVMGIVSSDPSVVGNAKDHVYKDDHYKIIGMLGQVPARVSAENGPIRPGDSLTSASSTPGYAMRASAGDPTMGVALERLNSGVGNIQVLISRRNKSLTVETIEQQITGRIAAMEIQDEVNLLISNAVDNLNIDRQIADVVNGEIVLLDARLTIEIDNLNGEINNTKNNFNLLSDRLAILENNLNDISGKLSNFVISDNGEIKMGNNATINSPVAVVEVSASSALSAFVIKQEGGGDLARFYNGDAEILNISRGGKVTIVGEMMVDGRIMVCSGGACGDNLDMAVDETMGDMGVEGKVVAHAFEGYCDDGWIWVPGSSKYGTMPGFCVMQYEASQSLLGLTESIIGSTPWVDLNQGEAQLACQALGSEYHLISENEWMTIANNIIRVADNDIDQVGEGLQLATSSASQLLSNYGEINNVVGGVAEWTDQTITSAGIVAPVSSAWQEYYSIIDYKGLNIAPPYYYGSVNGIGKILTGNNSESLRGFVRGEEGIYDLDLSNAPTATNKNIGFRCAK